MAQLNDTMLKPIAEIDAVSFNATSATDSVAMADDISHVLVQVMATANCHLKAPFVKDNTSAGATKTKSMPIPAWTPFVFKVPAKAKLSVIGNTASGTLFLTRME